MNHTVNHHQTAINNREQKSGVFLPEIYFLFYNRDLNNKC